MKNPSGSVDEIEGRSGVSTRARSREVTRARGVRMAVEALTYNNPFGQVMERVWFDGKVVFAVGLGRVAVSASGVKVAY